MFFALQSQFSVGQQLLNGGFEDILTTDSPHPFPVPEFWETVFPAFDLAIARLDEESNSGEWAMKLETGDNWGLKVSKLSTLFYSADLVSEIYGHPLNHSPNQLSFYYKYLPEGGDTARVSVLLFNFPDSLPFHNPYLSYIDTLFYIEQDIADAVETYTQMLLDLDFESNPDPEYIQVEFVTNKHATAFGHLSPAQGTPGTTLWVDDVELMYPVSTADRKVTESDIALFPLPAVDFFQIQKPENVSIQSAVLYDLSGQQRMVLNPTLNRHPVSDLPNGMYLLHLNFNEGHAVKKLLKQ